MKRTAGFPWHWVLSTPQGLMFPRFSLEVYFVDQKVGCRVRRNGASMNGFFSVAGPTTAEETRHARTMDRTTIYRYAPEFDARRTAPDAVCGGGGGDGWPCAEPLALGARSDRFGAPEGSTQAHRSAHWMRAHRAGSRTGRAGAACPTESWRASPGDCGGLVGGCARGRVCGVARGGDPTGHGARAQCLSARLPLGQDG